MGKGWRAGLSVPHMPLTVEELDTKRERETPKDSVAGSGNMGKILRAWHGKEASKRSVESAYA